MIKFIHTADIHFGVENYGRIDPKTGIHSRLLDFNTSLSRCVDEAIEKNVDFFLFCGDAYKTSSPSPTQQKLLLKLFLRLHAATIPVIIIVGNHDMPLSFGKAHSLDLFSDLPVEGFHIFSRPKVVTLETKNGLVNIVGIPWPTRHVLLTHNKHRTKNSDEISSYLSSQVGSIIADLASQLDPDIPAVLAGHLSVSSGVYSGSERKAVFGNDPTLLPSQLAVKPFDYVALGHLHRHQNLNQGSTPIVYSGSIEAIDFGEIRDKKGYCLVTIDRKKTPSCIYEFIPLPTRPMVKIHHVLDTKTSPTDQLLEVIQKHDLSNAIVKISYQLPPGDRDRVDITKIQQATSKAFCTASITPIHQPPVRQRRTPLGASTSTKERLTRYFRMKELEPQKIDSLLAKAQKLEAMIEGNKEENITTSKSLQSV